MKFTDASGQPVVEIMDFSARKLHKYTLDAMLEPRHVMLLKINNESPRYDYRGYVTNKLTAGSDVQLTTQPRPGEHLRAL